MAVISPPILKILSDLGIDLMDVDSDMDYLRALMEATNSLTISNPSDRRIPILQKEVKRVRDNRRAKSQIVKKKVSTSKLLNRKDVGEKGKESNTGKLSRILRDTRGRVLSNEKRLDNLKQEEKQTEDSDNQSFNPIIDGLNSIIETLRSDRKFNKKKTEKQRKEKEKTKRASKEKLLEGAKGVWKGVSKIAGKVLGPFADIWSKILGFITKIFLGRVLFKLVDWVGNPANQDKVKSIFRFLKDWWPLLLGAYIVFGTGLAGFATGLISSLIGFAITLKATVIPALITAAKMMGPWGWKALAILGGGMLVGAIVNKVVNKDKDKGDNISTDKQNQVESVEASTSSLSQEEGDLKTRKDDSRQGFNKGGKVPGRGANKDTVPAMLTPGEFVMSRDAVDQWGADTLAGMNAAAGGTNRPTLGRYKTGGKVQTMSEQLGHTRGTVTDPEKKKRIEEETLYWVNKERAFLGLPPLDKISYADGVELTEPMGKEFYGAGITEESSDDWNFDTMTRTTTRWKQRGSKMIFEGGEERITEEQKQAYFDSNPVARMARDLKEQAELDDLGASISASAKMKGGGLVQGFRGGGLVQSQIDQYKKLKLERSRIERDPDGKIRGNDRKKWNQLSKEMNKLAKQIQASQKSTSTPTVTPTESKTKTGSGLFGGIKRVVGGTADQLTGNLFDFDKRSGGGLIRKTAGALARPMGGLADQLTGNLFDFDKRSGGGLIRKTAGAVGGLLGGAKGGAKGGGSGILGPISSDPSKMVNMNAMKKDKDLDISPSSKKPKVTVAYQDQLTDSTPSTPPAGGGNKKIPTFSAIAMRSVDKIRVLGISV